MIAALFKAAIFYWIFITIRKLLKTKGVLGPGRQSRGPEQTYEAPRKQTQNNEDVIEADYRVID